ncbi:hypothetical protein [Sorangium sp. So ce590]|uniref:hypothetical protein n=1 Tax=unclassified Sorangium TaxID=2621164 RepID=UPI003F60898F
MLERMLRAGDADNALDLGWLLREVRERFGRTPSWVSRRRCKNNLVRVHEELVAAGAKLSIHG